MMEVPQVAKLIDAIDYIKHAFFQGIFIYFVASFSSVKYGKYQYPEWAEVLGLLISFSSMMWVPLYAVYYLIKGVWMKADYGSLGQASAVDHTSPNGEDLLFISTFFYLLQNDRGWWTPSRRGPPLTLPAQQQKFPTTTKTQQELQGEASWRKVHTCQRVVRLMTSTTIKLAAQPRMFRPFPTSTPKRHSCNRLTMTDESMKRI